jgi:hypothetical protein
MLGYITLTHDVTGFTLTALTARLLRKFHPYKKEKKGCIFVQARMQPFFSFLHGYIIYTFWFSP